MEEGAMITKMELMNIPFGWIGKGDSNCNGNGDGMS